MLSYYMYIVVMIEQQYNVNTLCTEYRYKHKCTQTLQYITTSTCTCIMYVVLSES